MSRSLRAVLLDNQMGDYFHTTVGVRHGVLLSPVLLNIFLEGIMPETLHDQHTSILLYGRLTCNIRFANRFHGRHLQRTARPDRQLQHIWNGHQQSRVEREAKTEIYIKGAHLEKKKVLTTWELSFPKKATPRQTSASGTQQGHR